MPMLDLLLASGEALSFDEIAEDTATGWRQSMELLQNGSRGLRRRNLRLARAETQRKNGNHTGRKTCPRMRDGERAIFFSV